MEKITVICVLFSIILAGCVGPFGMPTAQEEPAPVKLENNATITETFTVAIVNLGSNLTVTRENNEQGSYTINEGSLTVKNPDTNEFTKVQFPASAFIHGNYTLGPGENKTISVENITPDKAIVILVYDDPEQSYRAIKSLSCRGPILGYEVVTQAEGEDQTVSIHECGTNFL